MGNVWTRCANGDSLLWVSPTEVWRVRGPLMGKPMFWLYHNGHRVNTTGRYADSLSFRTLAAAQAHVAALVDA